MGIVNALGSSTSRHSHGFDVTCRISANSGVRVRVDRSIGHYSQFQTRPKSRNLSLTCFGSAGFCDRIFYSVSAIIRIGWVRNGEVIVSKKLYVGNLPFKITQDDIQRLFAEAGPVKEVYLATDRDTEKSSGFGFVEMVTEAAALKAIEMFHGYTIQDRSLTVKAIDPTRSREWRGSANNIVFHKSPQPEKQEDKDDRKR